MPQTVKIAEQGLLFMGICQFKIMKAKIVFVTLIASLIFIFVLILSNNKKNQTIRTSAAVPVITPVQLSELTSMDSPEGSQTLRLNKNIKDNSVSYSLVKTIKESGTTFKIFSTDLKMDQSLEIPYNTWSPDNGFVFLKKKTTSLNDYLVFNSSGELFPENQPLLSIQELFQKNIKGYVIEDVTGWADPNSLIVNTLATENRNKVSFWFYVPSQEFIQLSTYFK